MKKLFKNFKSKEHRQLIHNDFWLKEILYTIEMTDNEKSLDGDEIQHIRDICIEAIGDNEKFYFED